MSVIVRFAPSPTGFLHIGGARTALFNWLFARHHGGSFRLRIEDTDRARSTQEAVAAIIDGLSWLGLDCDGDIVMQSARSAVHAAAAERLVATGHAYHCTCTAAELAALRERSRAAGRTLRCPCRERGAPLPGVAPALRFRAPMEGETVIDDLVQGRVTVANEQLDDLVILRADGTPTYNLSVVVDDHDMAISHVIRGDDHLTNAFRQTQIYEALGWATPRFGHIPLIHGPDGAKLSKRHGALGVEAYRDMGYLPEALRNYLLRLGWAHGDAEIITTEQAIAWFDVDAVGRAPARFDFAKLASVNAHYIREAEDTRLAALVVARLEPALGPLDAAARALLLRAMPSLKPRAKTIVELAEKARFLVAPRPLALDAKAAALLGPEARSRLAALGPALAAVAWDEPTLEAAVRQFAESGGVKLGDAAQPLRAALTGSTASPGLFEVMVLLGRAESLARLADASSPAVC